MIKLNMCNIEAMGNKAIYELLKQMKYVKLDRRYDQDWLGRSYYETVLYVKHRNDLYWTQIIMETLYDTDSDKVITTSWEIQSNKIVESNIMMDLVANAEIAWMWTIYE